MEECKGFGNTSGIPGFYHQIRDFLMYIYKYFISTNSTIQANKHPNDEETLKKPQKFTPHSWKRQVLRPIHHHLGRPKFNISQIDCFIIIFTIFLGHKMGPLRPFWDKRVFFDNLRHFDDLCIVKAILLQKTTYSRLRSFCGFFISRCTFQGFRCLRRLSLSISSSLLGPLEGRWGCASVPDGSWIREWSQRSFRWSCCILCEDPVRLFNLFEKLETTWHQWSHPEVELRNHLLDTTSSSILRCNKELATRLPTVGSMMDTTFWNSAMPGRSLRISLLEWFCWWIVIRRFPFFCIDDLHPGF